MKLKCTAPFTQAAPAPAMRHAHRRGVVNIITSLHFLPMAHTLLHGPPYPFASPSDVDILRAVRHANPGELLALLVTEDALSAAYVRALCARIATRDNPPGDLLARLWRYVARHSPLDPKRACFYAEAPTWARELLPEDVPAHAAAGSEAREGVVIGGCAARGLNPYVWTFALAVGLADGASEASAACLDLLLACRLTEPACAYLTSGAWAVANVARVCPRALVAALALAKWSCANSLLLPPGVKAALQARLGHDATEGLREVPERSARSAHAGHAVSCMLVLDGRLVPQGAGNAGGAVPVVAPDCPAEVFVALRHIGCPVDNPLYQAALLFMGYFTSIFDVLTVRAKLVYPNTRGVTGPLGFFTDADPEDWALPVCPPSVAADTA